MGGPLMSNHRILGKKNDCLCSHFFCLHISNLHSNQDVNYRIHKRFTPQIYAQQLVCRVLLKLFL